MLPELAAPHQCAGQIGARCLDSYRPGARTVAAILAAGLRAQGLDCPYTPGATAIQATAPGPTPPAAPGVELLLVADEDLLADPATLAGSSPATVLVVATLRPPGAVRRQLAGFAGTVVTVPADRIAGARSTDVGLPLLGAACRALPHLNLAAVAAAVWDYYAGAWPGAGPSAQQALVEGYRQARI